LSIRNVTKSHYYVGIGTLDIWTIFSSQTNTELFAQQMTSHPRVGFDRMSIADQGVRNSKHHIVKAKSSAMEMPLKETCPQILVHICNAKI
jgi:hypothetical protein